MSNPGRRLTARETALLELAAGRVYELARQAETFERALRDQAALVERLLASVASLARENQALRAERDALRMALDRGRPTPSAIAPGRQRVESPPARITPIAGARMAPQRAA